VCASGESVYFVSNNGKLIEMSLPTLTEVDQMYNQYTPQQCMENSMEYSVQQLDSLEQELSTARTTDLALSSRIYEWNCALHIMRGIKAHSRAQPFSQNAALPFKCSVSGLLLNASSSQTCGLRIKIRNNTMYPLKDWSLIVLLQRLCVNDTPQVKSITVILSHLPVGGQWEHVCEHNSLGESYDPLQVSLFLAYSVSAETTNTLLSSHSVFSSSVLGRSGFCTEIYSKRLSLLDFIMQVKESNILAHSHVVPNERSRSFRCVRALLSEPSFSGQIKAQNQSVQRVQLLVSSVAYHQLRHVLPYNQFVTSKNHLVHFWAQQHEGANGDGPLKETAQESRIPAPKATYLLTFQSSNDQVLHYIYHALVASIVPLQIEYDQSKCSNSKQTFEELDSALRDTRTTLQLLHNDLHDCIYEYKQNEHTFPLEEVQEQGVIFAQRIRGMYGAVRGTIQQTGIIY